MMPIFRVRSSEYTLGIGFDPRCGELPLEMGECLVGFRHLVSVFFLLHRVSLVVRGGDKFCRKLERHRLVFAFAGVADQPPDREGDAPVGTHFRRYLVRCAADATRADFKERLDVADGLLEDFQARPLPALLGDREGVVDDAPRKGFLPLLQHAVDELRHQDVVVLGVGCGYSSCRCLLAHSVYLGFLAPYLDLPCFRSATPAVSSVPRTMW